MLYWLENKVQISFTSTYPVSNNRIFICSLIWFAVELSMELVLFVWVFEIFLFLSFLISWLEKLFKGQMIQKVFAYSDTKSVNFLN
jgi:hypothetical protein